MGFKDYKGVLLDDDVGMILFLNWWLLGSGYSSKLAFCGAKYIESIDAR